MKGRLSAVGVTAVVLTGLMLAGCARTVVHQPMRQPIEAGEVSTIDIAAPLSVRMGEVSSERLRLGRLGAAGGEYVSDLDTLTRFYTAQLITQLQAMGVPSGDGSPRTMVVRVTDASFNNRVMYNESRVAIEITLGSGETVSFEKVGVSTKTRDRATNGAVRDAVIETLNHPDVRAYLEA